MPAEIDLSLDFELFQEPASYRPPTPEPTMTTFMRKNGSALKLHLAAKHSLWAHHLWNAGQSIAHYLDLNTSLYKNKNVLELGAASSLPSIICCINEAATVVSTDYPDPCLLLAITKNAIENCPLALQDARFVVKGYLWGADTTELQSIASGGYDLIILSDLIFNHSEHSKILQSCRESISESGIVLCSHSHHLPQHKLKDLNFFELAKQAGWRCEPVQQESWEPMFPEDKGDLGDRGTVWIVKLWIE